MGFYRDKIVPHLIDFAMRHPMAKAERPGVVGPAVGKILEVGIGSGFNLDHYPTEVEQILAVEPSDILRNKTKIRADGLGMNVSFAGTDAREIELNDNSVDTVVMTWVLCSIPEPEKAISEIRRVLKPGGKLLFIEHGLASNEGVAKWQNRLNPAWHVCSGGCNINRRPDKLMLDGGFGFEKLESGFADGPKLLAFEYKGVAH